MDVVIHGLQFSLIGLLSIFLFMLLFWGIMALLPKLFPEKSETQMEEIRMTLQGEHENPDDPGGEELAAVIAAAVAAIWASADGSLGSRLEEGRGPWWSGRSMAARHHSVGERSR